MAFNFGQFRRSQLGTFMNNASYTMTTKQTTSTTLTGTTFIDPVLRPSANFQQNQSFYINFTIPQISTQLSITLKLISTTRQEDTEQQIETIVIPKGNSSYTFERIINPNGTYDQLAFEIQRTPDDYNQHNSDGTYGRKITVSIGNFSQMVDIISGYLSSKLRSSNNLKQIGVQGTPGLMMSINNEQIKVGRSGFYEINNGITIDSICFAVVPNDNKYFILDYQY